MKKVNEIKLRDNKSLQLEQKILHLKSEVEKYKGLLESFRSNKFFINLDNENKFLTGQNKILQEGLSFQEKEYSILKKEVIRLENIIKDQLHDKWEISEVNQLLKQESSMNKQKLEACEEQIKKVLIDFSKLKEKMNEQQDHNHMEYPLKHCQLSNEIQILKSDLNKITTFIESTLTVGQQIENMREEAILVSNDVKEIHELIEKQFEETNHLKNQIEFLASKFDYFQEAILSVVEKRDSQLSSLAEDYSGLNEEKDEWEKKINDINAQIEILKKELRNYNDEREMQDIDQVKFLLSTFIEKIDGLDEKLELSPKQKENEVNKSPLSTTLQNLPHVEKNFLNHNEMWQMPKTFVNEKSDNRSFMDLFKDEKKQIVVRPTKHMISSDNRDQQFTNFPKTLLNSSVTNHEVNNNQFSKASIQMLNSVEGNESLTIDNEKQRIEVTYGDEVNQNSNNDNLRDNESNLYINEMEQPKKVSNMSESEEEIKNKAIGNNQVPDKRLDEEIKDETIENNRISDQRLDEEIKDETIENNRISDKRLDEEIKNETIENNQTADKQEEEETQKKKNWLLSFFLN